MTDPPFERRWLILAGLSVAQLMVTLDATIVNIALTMSLLATAFTRPEKRNKAFGVFSAIAGSGASVGLLLGGVLFAAQTGAAPVLVH